MSRTASKCASEWEGGNSPRAVAKLDSTLGNARNGDRRGCEKNKEAVSGSEAVGRDVADGQRKEGAARCGKDAAEDRVPRSLPSLRKFEGRLLSPPCRNVAFEKSSLE